MNLDKDTIDFIERNNISMSEILRIENLAHIKLKNPQLIFDKKKYAQFGILKLNIIDKDIKLEPILLGKTDNLSKLNKYLWENSSNNWIEEMHDLSNRGTFLKRVILINTILNEVKTASNVNNMIIDLGCGDGILYKELINISENVFGVDFAETFISKLKKEIKNKDEYLIVKDILKLGFKENFDIGIASTLLLGIPDIDTALDNIYDSLKKNGILIIADVNSDRHRCLGYYDKKDKFHVVHDKDKKLHIEKYIGGGKSIAIHNHHPFNYYRSYLENKGMRCLKDIILNINEEDVINRKDLNDSEKYKLLMVLKKDIDSAPFHLVVMEK